MVRRVSLVLFVTCVFLAAGSPAEAAPTPFGIRVNDAIERTVQYFRDHNTHEGSAQWATGLATLCMLEKRASADWNAPAVGYLGMDAEDQDRMRSAAAFMVSMDPALRGQGTAYSYGTGSNLMALSLYLASGGAVDAPQINALEAVRNGMNGLRATQGNSGCNQGGWNYYNAGSDGDMSCTQFALAGVSAARTVLFDDDDLANIDASLVAVREFSTNAKANDGGHSYRGCRLSSTHSMTASGIWTYRLSGLEAHEELVQSALTWWRDRYHYQTISGSYFYALWAASKAFLVSRDRGHFRPGEGVYGQDIGGLRDPVEDGFPEEEAGWYYDFAWRLTEIQGDDGSWAGPTQNGFATTAWACLVLEKSLGGVCIDQDEDGLCEGEDNCPSRFNPVQIDADADGLGDECDNCPLMQNLGQEDLDDDGIGDPCDKLACVPSNDGIEICDGVDNDCDFEVDEGEFEPPPGAAELCRTDRPGVCARGEWVCQGGALHCQAVAHGDREEVCDLLDNDCDGRIDEGARNACGRCGMLAVEVCNNIDDDCNGLLDDGAACGEGELCVAGECAARCEGGGLCPDGLVCEDSYCVTPCAGVECAPGEVCEEGGCSDPCVGVLCEPGDACVGGECGNCLDLGCPPGEACVAEGGGVCVPDPCDGVECGATQLCRAGECIESCAEVSCAIGQVCRGGACISSPCGGVECEDGSACTPVDEVSFDEEGNEVVRKVGACLPDPCEDVECERGFLCHAGSCQEDECSLTTCPDGTRCLTACFELDEGTVCETACLADWLPPSLGKAPPPGDGGEGEVTDIDEREGGDLPPGESGGDEGTEDPRVDPNGEDPSKLGESGGEDAGSSCGLSVVAPAGPAGVRWAPWRSLLAAWARR